MTRFLVTMLIAALVGLAAAWISPETPHQIPRGGAVNQDTKSTFFDAGLDNPEIEADENIEAARKCGFCMG